MPRSETLRDILNRRFVEPRSEGERVRWLFGIAPVEAPPVEVTSNAAEQAAASMVVPSLREQVAANRRRLFGIAAVRGARVPEDPIADSSSSDGDGIALIAPPRRLAQLEELHEAHQAAEPRASNGEGGGLDALDALAALHSRVRPPGAAPATKRVPVPALLEAEGRKGGGWEVAVARRPSHTSDAPVVPLSAPRRPLAEPLSVEQLLEQVGRRSGCGADTGNAGGGSGDVAPCRPFIVSQPKLTPPRRLSISDAERLIDGMAPSQQQAAVAGAGRTSGGVGSGAGPLVPAVAAVAAMLNCSYEAWAAANFEPALIASVEALSVTCAIATLACRVRADTLPSPRCTAGEAIEVLMPLTLRREIGVAVGHELSIGAPFFAFGSPGSASCARHVLLVTSCVRLTASAAAHAAQGFRYPGLDSAVVEPGHAPKELSNGGRRGGGGGGGDPFFEGPSLDWHVPLATLQAFTTGSI